MLEGLQEVESELAAKGIGFRVLVGDPGREALDLLAETEAAALVIDFDPLRPKRHWREQVVQGSKVTSYEVDAHNIVPCWAASGKREWAAATFRPKIERLLPQYLTEPAPTSSPSRPWDEGGTTDWERVRAALQVGEAGPSLSWARPGPRAAVEALRSFLDVGLAGYGEGRNDPVRDGQSGLSPYLHFGHLSPQRAAWEAFVADAPQASKDAFLEELVVRRELSDNFCWNVPDYDSFGAFPEWARSTLDQHRFDEREYLYTESELERARTHDPLWNAAQMEMVKRGKMHGYLRMYWAKKILEWTETPEEALRVAILLNDRYELDGRDPNGYAGIAWSIGGVHDRAWPSRKVFGKVRYMSYSGAKAKFDVGAYIERVESL
jgi:deoxyribodipyrimidine photo-lyase